MPKTKIKAMRTGYKFVASKKVKDWRKAVRVVRPGAVKTEKK